MSNNLDKDILNKAWNDMHGLLDNHMPNKKSNLWFLWVSMGAILFLSIGYWISVIQKESSSQELINQKIELPKEPIASLFSNTASDDLINKNGDKSSRLSLESTNISVTPNTNPIDNNSVDKAPIKSKNQLSHITTKSIDVLSNHKKKVFSAKSEYSTTSPKNNLLIDKNDSNKESLQNNNSVGKSKVATVPKTSSPIIEKISLIDPKLLLSDKYDNVNLTNSTFVNISTYRNSYWGLMTGFFSDNFRSLNGIQFGFFRSSPLTQNTRINYGLSIDAMFKKGFQDVLASSDKNELFSFKAPNSGVPETDIEKQSTYDGILKSVDQLYYANLPVDLNIGLSPKFGINVGINLSYLLYGTNDNRIRTKSNNFNFVDNGALFDKRILNRFDLGIEGGLSYKINSKINTNISYRYGISQIISKSQYYDRVDFNRTFDISIEYLL